MSNLFDVKIVNLLTKQLITNKLAYRVQIVHIHIFFQSHKYFYQIIKYLNFFVMLIILIFKS